MLDTKKMSVEEVRNVLVTEYGLSLDEANALTPKSAVVAKLRELEAPEDALDTVEVVEDKLETVGDDDETPTRNDKNWTAYVMSLMYDDEVIEGHPTVDGLRRVTEQLMGPIVNITSKVLQVPDINNNFHATVRVRIDTEIARVDGCADAGGNNCKPTFAIHPVAMAESRAESRAYRRLLRLRNIITAEEVVKEEQIIDQYEAVTATQTKIIDNLCSKLDINVEKWLTTHAIKLADYNKLQKNEVITLCEELNNLRASGTVPEDIKGFDFNWRQ